MTPQNPTVIDIIGDGYRTINRRPLIILLPVLLNVYLWFGAQLSFQPLLNDVAGLMERLQPASSPADPAVLTALREVGTIDMRQRLAVLNYVPTIPLTQSIGLPDGVSAIQVGSVGGALLAFLLINIVALPLSAGFLTRMAEAVRGEKPGAGAWARSSARATASLLGTAAIMAGMGLVLLLPFAVFTSILMSISQGVATFAMGLMILAVFWILIYLGFVNEAITVGGLTPLQALHASFNIVRQNLWGTLGLLAISYIISAGCAVIWRELVWSPVGVGVAILGSAYIGCGLQAARMIFFQDRLRRWKGLPQQPSSKRETT